MVNHASSFGKKISIRVKLDPKVLRASKVVAEMCHVSRNEVIELGLSKVFSDVVDYLEGLGHE